MSLGGPVERPGRLQLVPIPEEGDFGILEAATGSPSRGSGGREALASLGHTTGYAESWYPFCASQGRLCTDLQAVAYRSKGPSGGVVSTQHRGRPLEDARAGGAWRV